MPVIANLSLSILMLLTACSPAWSQPAKPPDPAAIDAIVRNALKAWQVPGVAVGIVNKGEIVYLKGHGIRSLTGADPGPPPGGPVRRLSPGLPGSGSHPRRYPARP